MLKNSSIICIALIIGVCASSCEPLKISPDDKAMQLVNNPDLLESTTNSLKIDLIAFYPFNNNVNDESSNNHDGINIAATPVCDRFNNAKAALDFNGKTSFVSIKDSVDLRLSNTDFTINYWVNLDEYYPLSGSAVLSKNNGAYQNGWNCSITGHSFITGQIGRAFYNVSGGSDPWAVGEKIIELEKWTMITTIYSLSNQSIRFYINGTFDHTEWNIPTPNPLTNVNLQIGKNSFNDPRGTTPSYFINGKLDDIRIYSRPLKESEVSDLYQLPN